MLGFRRLSGKHHAEKTVQHGEETFGRLAGHSRRRHSRAQALWPDGDHGGQCFGRLIEDIGVLVECWPPEQQTQGRLLLSFGVGSGRVLSSLPALLGLLYIEPIEAFEVASGRALELAVVQIGQHVKPQNVRLLLQIEVIGINKFDQRQLARGGNKCYHEFVLVDNEGGFLLTFSFVFSRTFYCAIGKEICKILPSFQSTIAVENRILGKSGSPQNKKLAATRLFARKLKEAI